MKAVLPLFLASVVIAQPVISAPVSRIDLSLSAVLGADAADNPATLRDDTGLSLDDSHSLIGLSGFEEMNTGLVIGGRLEVVVRADNGEIDTDPGLAFVSLTSGMGEFRFGRVHTAYHSASDHPWRIDESALLGDRSLKYVSDAVSWRREWAPWRLAVLAAFDGGNTRQQATLAYGHDKGEISVGVDRQVGRLSVAGLALPDLSSLTLGGHWLLGGDIRIRAAATQFDFNDAQTAALLAEQPGNTADSAFGSLVVAEYERSGNTFALGYENGNWELENDARFVFELQRGLSERSNVWMSVSAADAGSSFRVGLQHSW